MRLIDADALMKHIKDVPTWQDCDEYLWKATNYPHGMYNPEDIVSSIENTPAVDAVEVVHCGSCRHAENELDNGWMWCNEWQSGTNSGGFCHKGERKADG